MKIRFAAAALAAFLMLPFMGTVAYAGGGDCPEPEPATEVTVIPATEGPADETELNPFTPAGTGTVVDHATDGDGKEFYTIITPAENVFYLVIDRQREQENVYFLNAVTEADLMALAEIPPTPEPAPVEQAPAPTPEPEPVPEPEPEKGGGMGMLIFVVLVVLVGGGAGYYFKIYRPKQQQADMGDGDEYEGGEDDIYDGDDYGAEPDGGRLPDDDDPPWYDGDDGDGEA